MQYSVHRGKQCGAQKSEASSDLSLKGSRKERLRTRPLADFPGDLVIKTLLFHCKFNLWLGNYDRTGMVKKKKKNKGQKKDSRPLEFKSWICGLLSELESKFLNPSLLILFVSPKVLAHSSHHCCKNSTSSYM